MAKAIDKTQMAKAKEAGAALELVANLVDDEALGDLVARIDGGEALSVSEQVRFQSAVLAIQEQLTDPVIEVLRQNEGSELGYDTDRPAFGSKAKDKRGRGPYTNDEMRKVFTAAMLRGYMVVNNEFNVISGKLMGVYNGVKRKFESLTGITDVDVRPAELPQRGIVSIAYSYRVHGKVKDGIMHWRIPGDDDMVVTKAKRRTYKVLLEAESGRRWGEDDEDIRPESQLDKPQQEELPVHEKAPELPTDQPQEAEFLDTVKFKEAIAKCHDPAQIEKYRQTARAKARDDVQRGWVDLVCDNQLNELENATS